MNPRPFLNFLYFADVIKCVLHEFRSCFHRILIAFCFFFSLFSGLDVVSILNYIGLESMSSSVSSNVATGASTFVIAYAVHKVFAPIRISITLFSAPFIVRYLRNRGILKPKSTTK